MGVFTSPDHCSMDPAAILPLFATNSNTTTCVLGGTNGPSYYLHTTYTIFKHLEAHILPLSMFLTNAPILPQSQNMH